MRDEAAIQAGVEQTVAAFGGIHICVNNASAVSLSKIADTEAKRFDLMQDINARGTFLLSKVAIPYLEASDRAHILTLSPPIDLRPKWAGSYLAYTMAKYGMSLVTLGLAEELREAGIAVNSLWPRTTIATAAVVNLLGGDDTVGRSRTPEIMADAAHAVLVRDSRVCTGNFFIDEDVLAEEGITDLEQYRVGSGEQTLEADLFLDPLEESA